MLIEHESHRGQCVVSTPLHRDVRTGIRMLAVQARPVLGGVETSPVSAPFGWAEAASPDVPCASQLSWSTRPTRRKYAASQWHANEHARSGKKRPVLLEVFGSPSCSAGRAPRGNPVAAASGRYRFSDTGGLLPPGFEVFSRCRGPRPPVTTGISSSEEAGSVVKRWSIHDDARNGALPNAIAMHTTTGGESPFHRCE